MINDDNIFIFGLIVMTCLSLALGNGNFGQQLMKLFSFDVHGCDFHVLFEHLTCDGLSVH